MNTSARLSAGLFLLGMSALIVAFTISCKDGGGGSAGAQTATATPYRIHETAASGIIPIPASSTGYVAYSAVFTPTTPNDMILRVQVEGTSTGTGTQGSAYFQVLNSSGVSVGGGGSIDLPIAIDLPFKTSVALHADLPSSFYTIQFKATTDAAWVGSVNTLVVKIWTLEGAYVLSPSPSIS